MKTEFGKGTIYPLVLFACHIERQRLGTSMDYSLWFNGASDHLYELEIPKSWEGKLLGKKLHTLKNTALAIGHGIRMLEKDDICKKEFLKCKKLTKEIAFLIDLELGFSPVKAEWD